MLGIPSLPVWALLVGWYDDLPPNEKLFWFTATLVAAVSLSVVLAHTFAVFYDNYKERKKRSGFDGTIVFECTESHFPEIVPPEGKINTLSMFFQASNPEFQAIGSSIRYGKPGEHWDWKGHDTCYKCIITNHSDTTALDLEITLLATYYARVSTDNGSKSGDMLGTHKYKVLIPALKANGETPYEFYMYSQGKLYASAVPEARAKINKMGSLSNIEVIMGYSSGGCMKVPMNFYPKGD